MKQSVRNATPLPRSNGSAEKRKRMRQRQKTAREATVQNARNRGNVNLFSDLHIPRNEQDKLSQVVHAKTAPIVRNYTSALIDPKYHRSRVPDAFARPTALAMSYQEITINGYTDTTSNSGRFSACIQPWLGGLNSPTQYKTAVVNAASGWPQYLDVPESFIVLDAPTGQDVRLDPNISLLTQPIHGVASFVGGSSTGASPFGPPSAVTQSSGYNLAVKYVELTDVSVFKPPPGQYTWEVMFYSATQDVTFTVSPHSGSTVTTTAQFSSSAAPTAMTGAFGYLSVPDAVGGAGITFSCSDGQPQTGGAVLCLTRTFTDSEGVPSFYNFGITNSYRPVGCAVLATYIGPLLTNGGAIAAGYLPGGTQLTQFFNVSGAGLGNVADWNFLAQQEGSYNGPIKDGAYAWWAPEKPQDYQFHQPDAALSQVFPPLIISGQWAPGTTPPVSDAIIRLEVVSLYEILSNSTLLEKEFLPGSQAIMDKVTLDLMGEPHTMANAAHKNFFQRILGGVAKGANFLVGNQDNIMKGLGMLSQLATSLA